MDLSKCVASEEDTLPDINTEKFTGAQRTEEDIGVQRNEFTGAPITGAPITSTLNEIKILEIEDDWIVTGTPSVMGAHKSTEHDTVTGALVTGALHENIMVTGANVTGTQEENIPVTGAPFTGTQWSDVRKTPDRISKARRRLSLSLWKSRAPENSVDVDDGEKLADYIIVDLSPLPLHTPSPTPSIEVLSDIEEPWIADSFMLCIYTFRHENMPVVGTVIWNKSDGTIAKLLWNIENMQRSSFKGEGDRRKWKLSV